jgi:hypothetical protein
LCGSVGCDVCLMHSCWSVSAVSAAPLCTVCFVSCEGQPSDLCTFRCSAANSRALAASLFDTSPCVSYYQTAVPREFPCTCLHKQLCHSQAAQQLLESVSLLSPRESLDI